MAKRAEEREDKKKEAELLHKALVFLYGTTFERWRAERLRCIERQKAWRKWVVRRKAQHDRQQEILRLERAARTIAKRKLCLLALKLREANPRVLKLKRPLVPRDASPGAVLVVFLTPVVIAIVAKLAGWTAVAVSLSGALPFGAILAGLLTPLPEGSSGVGRSRSRPLMMLVVALNVGGGALSLVGRVFGCLGICLLRVLECFCCGRFQEGLAFFVQCAMGVAAVMQVRDAWRLFSKGLPAAALIGLSIALVQLPDVLGWLFGEILKVAFIIRTIDAFNEVFNRVFKWAATHLPPHLAHRPYQKRPNQQVRPGQARPTSASPA